MILALLLALHTPPGHAEGLPTRRPSEVGMSTARLEAIERVVQRGIKAGGYPGAAVVVGRRGYSVYARGFGRLSWDPSNPDVSPTKTIYDLASVSKVIGTTSAAMALFDDGKLDLDAPVIRYVPAFADGGAKDRVTVRHLLTHHSGLPAGRDLWRIALSPAEARTALLLTTLRAEPGAVYEYSDLGMDVLALVLEAAAGEGLDTFLAHRIFAPLGMTDTQYRPADSLRYRIAPTEMTPPRGYPLRGEVHDENAYALGGVAGHAGLFSTASDMSIFAQMMLNGGEYSGARVFADSTVKLFTRRSSGTRGLGWDTCAGMHGCGDFLSTRAFGHIGYTGTSIWIDPDRDMFVVLLTNRVHAARAKRPAKVIADIRDDLADAAAWAVVDEPEIAITTVSFRADHATNWNKPLRTRHIRKGKRGKGSASAKAKAGARAGSKGRSVKAGTRTAQKRVATAKKAKTTPTGKKRAKAGNS